MSHVDEGTLHAYLDGELERVQPGATATLEGHVAGCEECRARLEEARRLRERASRILEQAGSPPVDVPPFDVVLRRARGARSAPGAAGPGHRRPFLPLAWAASIALALLGGWWAHDMARRTPPATVLFEAAVEAAGDVAPQPGAAAPPATAGQDAPASAPPAAPSLPAQRRPAQRATGSDEVAVQDRLAEPAARSVAASRTAAPAVGAVQGERVEAFIAPQTAAAPDARRGEAPRIAGGVDVAAPLVAADVSVAGADAWTPVDRAEAERRLGGKLILVEGLDVASIEAADSAGAPRVRVRQPLGAGVFLELVQQRAVAEKTAAAAGRAAAPSAPRQDTLAGRPPEAVPESLVVERDGFTVTLRAIVSTDSLRALAGRLR
ncbi:MAG TPA: zf-HC2 domain-containing protein [Longimicrobiales bacterium]